MNTTTLGTSARSIIASLLLLAAPGCAAPVGEEIGATSEALTETSVTAVGSLHVSELPATESLTVSFGSSTTVHQQLQALPPDIRDCVVPRLERLGLAAFLEPTAPADRVPVLSEQLGVQGGDCAGITVTLSFQQRLVGSNSSEPSYSITSTIIEWGRWAWNLLCREIVCLCEPNPTCGCDESDLASCDSCPTCPPPDFEDETGGGDGEPRPG